MGRSRRRILHANHGDQRPKRILSLEEMRALLEGADSEQYRCLLELLLTTGLRVGEALGLTVADLDAKNALIHVHRQLGRTEPLVVRTSVPARKQPSS